MGNVEAIGGALFFKVWVILFVAISGTPIMVRDRLVFENEYLNQTYRASTYCLATFLASLPYHLVSAVVYEAIVWYLVGFNDGGAQWVFSVASTFSLLLMMEGISLITVQVLKDAMLATTFSMVVLGTLFLFPGYEVATSNMVASIRWALHVVPTQCDRDSGRHEGTASRPSAATTAEPRAPCQATRCCSSTTHSTSRTTSGWTGSSSWCTWRPSALRTGCSCCCSIEVTGITRSLDRWIVACLQYASRLVT